jgi:GNAT superfamily N-acetyltransferase
MPSDSLIVTDDPAPSEVQFLEDQINEFNFATTGFNDGRLLSILVKDEQGQAAAGLYGWTWGGCAEVRFLWVRKDWRGQGYGRQLLSAAEAEAGRRGCTQVVLSTHSFQAPDFYQKLGYTIAGRFDNYPRGYQQFFLSKQLNGMINMDKEKLDTLITQIHTELDKAEPLDTTSRDSLRSLTTDIQTHAAPHSDPSLNDRLQASMAEFEADHPLVAQAIAQLLNGLAEAGV